jgi:hypothetical protein
MNHHGNLEADPVVQARVLLTAAKRGAELLAGAATLALRRLAGLQGLHTRVEHLAGSPEPGEAEAGAIDAATMCRQATAVDLADATRAAHPAPAPPPSWAVASARLAGGVPPRAGRRLTGGTGGRAGPRSGGLSWRTFTGRAGA